jgi:hypothetical protein
MHIRNQRLAGMITKLVRESLLQGVDELAAGDKALARVVNRHDPSPMWERSPGFATLINIILKEYKVSELTIIRV